MPTFGQALDIAVARVLRPGKPKRTDGSRRRDGLPPVSRSETERVALEAVTQGLCYAHANAQAPGLPDMARGTHLEAVANLDYIVDLHGRLSAQLQEKPTMGININDVYHGDNLKAEDLKGQQARLTIADIKVEEFDGKGKLTLGFNGTDRRLVLNVTNARMIAEMYGQDTDYWLGRQIVIAPEKTEFQGRIVDAIRVKYVQPPVNAPTANAGQAPLGNGLPDPGATIPGNRPIGGQSAGLGGEAPASGAPVDFAQDLDDDPIPFAPCRI